MNIMALEKVVDEISEDIGAICVKVDALISDYKCKGSKIVVKTFDDKFYEINRKTYPLKPVLVDEQYYSNF